MEAKIVLTMYEIFAADCNEANNQSITLAKG